MTAETAAPTPGVIVPKDFDFGSLDLGAMEIPEEVIQEALAVAKGENEGPREKVWWFPGMGKSLFRLVPYRRFSDGGWEFITSFQWHKGSRTGLSAPYDIKYTLPDGTEVLEYRKGDDIDVVCVAKTFGERGGCEICEKRFEWGKELDDWKHPVVKKLYPNFRSMANVLVLMDSATCPKCFNHDEQKKNCKTCNGMGFTDLERVKEGDVGEIGKVYKTTFIEDICSTLLSKAIDRKWGPIWHPIHGRNIEYELGKDKDRNNTHNCGPEPSVSRMGADLGWDDDRIRLALSQAVDLSQFKARPNDRIKALLPKLFDDLRHEIDHPDEQDEDGEPDGEVPLDGPTPATSAQVPSKYESIGTSTPALPPPASTTTASVAATTGAPLFSTASATPSFSTSKPAPTTTPAASSPAPAASTPAPQPTPASGVVVQDFDSTDTICATTGPVPASITNADGPYAGERKCYSWWQDIKNSECRLCKQSFNCMKKGRELVQIRKSAAQNPPPATS
jgi:hypothetical protein